MSKSLLILFSISVILGGLVLLPASSESVKYRYDDANRLVQVTYGAHSAIIYEYDASGNRTRKLVLGPNSKDTDSDGNALSDLYEYIYIGFVGTDGNLDVDGDGYTAIQESVIWTDPHNSNDYLYVGNIISTRNTESGEIVITWPSKEYASYDIERSTNGLESVMWLPVAIDIPAQPPMNSYTDEVMNVECVFYRISAD